MLVDVAPRGAAFVCEPLEGRRLLAVQLVADLNPATLGSEPERFVSAGAIAYFFAKVGETGIDLWRSDGTPAGTRLVRANLAAITYPENVAAVGPRLYFANTDARGAELWTSDGTEAGTVFVEDLNTGTEFNAPIGSLPGGFTAVGDPAAGRAVFGARGPDGRELFVTDGTADGTYQVADLLPGPANSWPFGFQRVGDAALFFANDTVGSALWTTDGTAAGTRKLASLGATNSMTGFPLVADDVLYFPAWSPTEPGRRVLWRSDGTAAGTRPLGGSNVNDPAYFPGEFTSAGGFVWFAATDGPGAASADLWRTDGTAAGTVKAIDLPASTGNIYKLTHVGGGTLAFYSADTAAATWQVWWGDGTPAGTRVIKTFSQANNRAGLDGGFGFQAVGDRVLFLAYDAEHGRDFWMTDGTPEGTVPLDLNPGPGWAVSTNGNHEPRVARAGDRLVFQAAGATGDTEPWVSDGTAAGTRKLADVNSAGAGSTISRPLVRAGGGIIFDADGKLLFTDGTPGHVIRLADMTLLNTHEILESVSAHSSAVLPDGVAVFAVANADGTVRRVYRSDGTPEGTYALGNLDPAPKLSATQPYWVQGSAAPFVFAGGYVYFAASDGTRGVELWKTDGTVAGTALVKDIAPGAANGIQGLNVPALAAVGDVVFFKGHDDQLWKSDGTDVGTVLVKDMDLGVAAGVEFHSFVGVGGRLFFEGGRGYLHTSDGTVGGTVKLLDRVEVVSAIVGVGGTAYFWGRDITTGVARLYRSGGTAAETVRVESFDGTPTETIERRRPIVAHDGMLYFAAQTTAAGAELWKTDGTDAGTKLVADVRPGTAGSRPTQLVSFDGRLYFFADDGVHGRELWSTDGTTNGTRLEQDIYPGPVPSSSVAPIFPHPVTAGGKLFLVAQDDVAGAEMRVLGAPAVAGRYLFYNHSAFDGRDPAAGVADDGAIAPDKAALLPGQAATFANVSGYSRGINGVMIDIHYVTADLDADDFEFRVGTGGDPSAWALAPAPLSVTERVPPALAAPTRVTLVWADGAVRNRWLRVTVKANADTHLTTPDVFYFGNLVGEAGDGSALAVGSGDLTRTRAAVSAGKAVGAGNAFDHNRDGRVDVLDVVVVRGNLGAALTPVATTVVALGERVGRRRGAWLEGVEGVVAQRG